MSKLNEKSEVIRNILKCFFIRYSPTEKSTINTSKSQISNNIHREDSVISLLSSYLDSSFDVLHVATNKRHAVDDDIRLVIRGPIALISNYELTNKSGKNLEDFSHAYFVSLKNRLITSSKDTDELSIGFDRDRGGRQRELNNNKNL